MNLKIALLTLISISLLFSMSSILNTARSEESKKESQEKKTEIAEKEEKVEIKKIFRGRRLLQENIDKKTQEWSPFIAPIPTYASENGAGFFLLGGIVYNGDKTNPYFEYAPYVLAMVAAASYNQEKQLNYGFSMDLPYFLNSPVNIFTAFFYTETFNMPYYGIGNQTNKHLFTRYGVRYNKYDNYNKRFLNAYDPFNALSPLYTKPVNEKFNQYIEKQYDALLLGTINITEYFIFNVGYVFKLFRIHSWAGKEFNHDKSKNVISMPTLIDLDPAVMRQKRDGLVSRVRFGIAFDTTDYKPDPRNGVLIDYTINISTKYLGADFSFFRHTFGVHGYYSPVHQLTFAARLAYTTTSGSVPFSELGTFSFIQGEQSGLGNETTLRGYQAQRFIGRTMTVGNLEVRWEFTEFKLFKQLFALKLIGFVDAGSVFNNPWEAFRVWSHYHIGYGPGFAIVWNQSIILRLYIGFSKEDTSIGLNFGHAF